MYNRYKKIIWNHLESKWNWFFIKIAHTFFFRRITEVKLECSINTITKKNSNPNHLDDSLISYTENIILNNIVTILLDDCFIKKIVNKNSLDWIRSLFLLKTYHTNITKSNKFLFDIRLIYFINFKFNSISN